MTVMINIVFEFSCAVTCFFIAFYLRASFRKHNIVNNPGRSLIVWGFLLMALGALVDTTDNFSDLSSFEIIGQTSTQAIFEGLFYLAGMGFLATGFLKWIPEIKKSGVLNDELSEREKRFRTLVETMTEGLITTDRAGNITYVNERMEKMLGQSRDHLIGRKYLEVSDDTFDRTMELNSYETSIRSNDGTVIPVLMSQKTMANELGNYEGDIRVFTDITEIKAVQNALTISEELHRAIFENLSVGIGLLDVQANWIRINKTAEQLLGFSQNELIGVSYFDIVPDQYKNESRKNIQKILSGEADQLRVEREYVRKDNSTMVGDISVSAIRDSAGLPLYILAVLTDITQRTQALERLEFERKQLLSVFDSLSAIVNVVDLETYEVLYVNRFTRELIKEIEPETKCYEAFHRLPKPCDFCARDKLINEGKTLCTSEYYSPFLQKNFYSTNRMIVWPDGRRVKLAFDIDITEMKMARESLAASEERYRKLVDLSPDGILLHDGTLVVMTNPAAAKILGANSPGNLIGQKVLDLVHPDYKHPISQRISRAIGEDRLQPMIEEKFKRLDGSYVDVEASAVPIRIGGTSLVQVIFRDISDRLAAQQSLKRLATAVEQSVEAIEITDCNGLIEYVNPAFEKTSGYSLEEIIGRKCNILKSGVQDGLFYRNLWNTVLEGSVWKGRLVNKRKDGSLFHEEATISPVRSQNGKITNFVAVKRDITEEIEMQRQLIQSQKMQAVGTLAGGIAHDFNNLLQVTLGYSEVLLNRMTEKDSGYQELSRIAQASQRGADLVKRLLTFSRKIEPRKKPLNVNDIISQTSQLLERTIPKMINVKLLLAPDLHTVNADPVQIEQVIMNLAINSRDAMTDGGDLIIETSNVIFKQGHLFDEGLFDGDYILIKVADTGSGMEPEIIEHIYEPFFTTKEVGKGSGLGLPTVFGIVKQHGGAILCDSRKDEGTTFRIYLPALEYSIPDDDHSDQFEIQPEGTETILIVDDEDFVRELAGDVLERAGYNVLFASNGREALEILRLKSKEIDLVLLDLIMPGMSGKNVLKEIKNLYRDMNVIVASGYSSGESEDLVLSLGAIAFVNKPYENRHLLKKIRQAIDLQKNED